LPSYGPYALNGDARGWLNLQQNYELECAERTIGDALKAIRPRVA